MDRISDAIVKVAKRQGVENAQPYIAGMTTDDFDAFCALVNLEVDGDFDYTRKVVMQWR